MYALKAGSRPCQGCTRLNTRSQFIPRPQQHLVQLHSSRVATRKAGPEGKEPEQPDKPEDQVSGTLSNRYAKMVEELQKAGLTPAKAKVRSHRRRWHVSSDDVQRPHPGSSSATAAFNVVRVPLQWAPMHTGHCCCCWHGLNTGHLVLPAAGLGPHPTNQPLVVVSTNTPNPNTDVPPPHHPKPPTACTLYALHNRTCSRPGQSWVRRTLRSSRPCWWSGA